MIKQIAPAMWEVNSPLSVMGMAIGHRMTVVRLPDKSLWLHSPVAYSPDLVDGLSELGRPAHVIAPNCVHDTYLDGWLAARPDLQYYAAPEFSKHHPGLKLHHTLADDAPTIWDEVFGQHVVRGIPRLNEVVFYHRASQSLILTDLCFNLSGEMPLLSRVLTTLNECSRGFGPSRLLKLAIKDRAALRSSLDRMMRWDFDRIVLSHGEVLEGGAKHALFDAFRFL